MVIFWSLLSSTRAFFYSVVWLERGAVALARVADTLTRSCSASVSASLLFLVADSIAVMRSTTGICSGATAKFSPLARTSFSGLVSSLGQIFHPLLLYVQMCSVVDFIISPVEHLFYVSCFDMPVKFGICVSYYSHSSTMLIKQTTAIV